MKTVYDRSNGSEVIAYPDPKNPDRFALPAGSTEIAPPEYDPKTEYVRFENGAWATHLIPDDSEETTEAFVPENVMDVLRSVRNERLRVSDFRVLPDYQGTDVAAWKTYRQALRDVPQNNPTPTWNSKTGEVENVNWPIPPST